MRIKVKCLALQVLKAEDNILFFHRGFDFLSFGYSKFAENRFAWITVFGFQVGVDWGFIDYWE